MNTSKYRWFYIALLVPGLITLLFVTAYPTLLTIWYSFTNLHLIWPIQKFIGLKNYAELLTGDTLFYSALLKDILWTATTVFFQLVIGLLAALALQKIKVGASLFRILLIVPWTFPDVSLAFLWKWMLEPTIGIFNYFLITLGIIDNPIGWFGSPERAFPSVMAMHIWFGFPFMMVALIAGLQSIPKSYYEAASLDGASVWQRFWHITLPSLKKIIVIVVVLRALWTFNNFSFMFLTTGGGPGTRTTILPLLIYQIGWRTQWLGKASSLAVISLLILMTGSILMLRVTEEDD